MNSYRSALLLAVAAAIAFFARTVEGSELIEVLPLSDRILVAHFKDGDVRHSTAGQPWGEETIHNSPLNLTAAKQTNTWSISSTNDAAYAPALRPARVGRKSKGTDFAWQPAPTWTLEHWIYLVLPQPMKHGATYVIDSGTLASNGRSRTLTFDEATARSEAVHANQAGYSTLSPQKFAYVFHWAGDLGGVNFSNYNGRAFHLVNQQNGRNEFSGKVAFRAPANQADTGQHGQSLNDNFEGSDVYECDFSTFTNTGRYVVSVDGVGCSFPFQVGPDVYRQAWITTARGLYHNRSGIALEAPYTKWPRPAPHNPVLTPGFTNKLFYTTVRFMEWGSEGGDSNALSAGIQGNLNSSGWYQDAGDFDSYIQHLSIPMNLLFAFECAPKNFASGELNLPESGNGLPDILNEASWLPRFCFRLRHELMDRGWSTGGIGLRICGDAFGSDTVPPSTCHGSWQDTNRTWVASGADPWSTYFYAGVAAQLAFCLDLAHASDPQHIDWLGEATNAYAWARTNTKPGDDALSGGQVPCPLKFLRAYAAAAIFRITGDKSFEDQFKQDIPKTSFNNWCWPQGNPSAPVMVYALAGGRYGSRYDSDRLTWARQSLVASARNNWLTFSCGRRACRWGGDFYMPMLVGQQTTPLVVEGMAAYAAAKRLGQSGVAEEFLGNLYTTADYFLGCNAANTTWVTGLGSRSPRQVFKLDCFCLGIHDGLIPYGPWVTDNTNYAGMWVTDHNYAGQTDYPGGA
ncbi:MAG: glycoside hydrolase family 9 protein, partial [Verrucomicrobiota bacterium]